MELVTLVHFQCPSSGLGVTTQHTPTTLQLQLCAEVSTMEVQKTVYLDSMSSASLRNLSKFCWRWRSGVPRRLPGTPSPTSVHIYIFQACDLGCTGATYTFKYPVGSWSHQMANPSAPYTVTPGKLGTLHIIWCTSTNDSDDPFSNSKEEGSNSLIHWKKKRITCHLKKHCLLLFCTTS